MSLQELNSMKLARGGMKILTPPWKIGDEIAKILEPDLAWGSKVGVWSTLEHNQPPPQDMYQILKLHRV